MDLRAKILSILPLFVLITAAVLGQSLRPGAGERIFVRGGVAETAIENRGKVNLGEMTPDSLFHYMAAIDSLRGDGIKFDRNRTDSLITSMIDRTSVTGDSLSTEQIDKLVDERKLQKLNPKSVRYLMDDTAFLNRYIGGGVDTLLTKLHFADTMRLTKRERRELAKQDTTAYRYNKFFRDSLKLSPMIAISLVAPGFSQFYNEQYWKIPVLYGTMAAGIGLGIWQSQKYKPYKNLYNYHLQRPPQQPDNGSDPNFASKERAYQETMTELQNNMIKHNTYRQLAFGFAAMSYIYFLVDGTLNYPSKVNDVKKATTLATVCPGAGQVYNKTYWKLPIVIGGGAVLIYCIDFNNRGYKRFKRAYDAVTNEDPLVVDEFEGRYSASYLLNLKDKYRRSRDLCIIFTGLFYIIQIVDAHATAHMKSYDISDDLAVNFEPFMSNYYSHRLGGNINTFGFSLNIHF